MYKKVLNILLNYYKAINSKEVVELVLTPVLIYIISYMFFNSSINKEVVISLNKDVLTLSGLLVAFGVCIITLLFTTYNKSISEAKDIKTERKVNGFNISYFQFIQLKAYYTVIMEILVVVICFINTIMLTRYYSNIIFYVLIFFTVHIILSLTTLIISMFHLSWKDRGD
ncbi:hypothetical protein KLN23_10185 [Clostridioides difficile]|nr:hypothetical protein [Clostridioides difficile]